MIQEYFEVFFAFCPKVVFQKLPVLRPCAGQRHSTAACINTHNHVFIQLRYHTTSLRQRKKMILTGSVSRKRLIDAMEKSETERLKLNQPKRANQR